MSVSRRAARVMARVLAVGMGLTASVMGPASLRAQSETQGKAESLELTESKAQLGTATMKLLEAQKTLRDWPNLGRYREANAKLGAAGAGEKRVVFMGDSITDLWAEPRFGGFF